MIRKEYLLSRIEQLEDRNSEHWKDILRLERLIEQLCDELGYTITYKQGLYLEPIEEDSENE